MSHCCVEFWVRQLVWIGVWKSRCRRMAISSLHVLEIRVADGGMCDVDVADLGNAKLMRATSGVQNLDDIISKQFSIAFWHYR
jgi:hypothetical protein